MIMVIRRLLGHFMKIKTKNEKTDVQRKN